MRMNIVTMTGASVIALAAFAAAPASAIQIAPGIGASDGNVIQVQAIQIQERRGGPGPRISGRSGRGGGEVSGRSPDSTFAIQGSGDGPRATTRGSRSGPTVSGRTGEPRVQYDRRRHGEWRGQLRHRGWSRDRRHVFYGSFLLGVPFGYAAVASHPCYDWAWGPHGWAYYWNYYRCPV